MYTQWPEYIERTPGVLGGKPVVKGTRISVELVLELLAGGWSQQQILDSYPTVKPEHIQACLLFAAEFISSETMYPISKVG